MTIGTRGTNETLGELIALGVLALQQGDRVAQRRRYRRLADALIRFENGWRAMGVRDDASIDEVRQQFLINLWRTMERWAEGATFPRDLAAYVSTVGRNAARDVLNRRTRLRKLHADRPIDDPVVESSGTFSLGELAARAEDERRMDERLARLHDHLESYIAKAGRTAVRDPRRMLTVWYRCRVQKRSAAEVAAEHGANEAKVWQWARRGALLIGRLADDDPDPDRAAMMRAVSMVA